MSDVTSSNTGQPPGDPENEFKMIEETDPETGMTWGRESKASIARDERLFSSAHAAYLADCQSRGVSPEEVDGANYSYVEPVTVWLTRMDGEQVFEYRESS